MSYPNNISAVRPGPVIAAPGFFKLLTFFILLFLSQSFFTAFAGSGSGDWDQFRGGARDGRIINKGTQWVEPLPELLWSKEIGSGFSEVVVVDSHIYLMMAEKVDSITGWETIVCMDAATGETLWSTRIDEVFIDDDDWGDGPRSTPAVDAHRVYGFSASGKLSALNRSNGNIEWIVDFVEQYGSTVPRWGYSTSPLLVDDLVIMEVGGVNDHGFGAFEKSTGALKWHTGNIAAAYNSPIAAEIDGSLQIIFANGSTLYSFDKNGNEMWTYTMPLRSPMALPLFIAPDMLFVSAANDAGSFIIRISGNEPEEIMRSSIMRNDFSSSCYKDGYIYGFNVATLQCIDAETGRRLWLSRGFGKGSLIMVNDRLIVLSDLGKLTMVEATPEAYIKIAEWDALEGRSWTAPSYANGKLYVRNHSRIACFRILEPVTQMDDNI